jgi:hypothetical protein
MLTPEKRHGSERRAEAEHIERRSLPLTLGNNPVFDADVLTTMRIGPTCDVAGGVDVWFARLEVLIHDNPAVGFETCLLGKLEAGPNADTYDYEISIERVASFEFHPFAIDGSYRFFEVEVDAVFLVQASPICGPRIRSIGRFSGATTWTSSSRARNAAVTSMSASHRPSLPGGE